MKVKVGLDLISQIFIVIFGVTAVMLLAYDRKEGFLVGLVGQPFFFITAWKNKQWGLLILTVIYTVSWAIGVFRWINVVH